MKGSSYSLFGSSCL